MNPNPSPIPTRESLQSTLDNPAIPDSQKGWDICRYLRANIGENLPSADARTLLLTYLRLPLPRPAALHSKILSVALKAADVYPDFRLPPFVKLWGIHNLTAKDYERQTANDGRTFSSLAERLARTLLRYAITHQDESIDPDTMTWAQEQGAKIGFLPALPMVAVKMFEKQIERGKMRMVKLVGADGTELSAEWHIFQAKPWEISGKMYMVLPRRAAESGNVRVDTIAVCNRPVDEAFGRIIGYVDAYDASHRHYHIFDAESRHFVAEAPKFAPKVGSYVWFAPIVPKEDKFKSAIVIAPETLETGRNAFGTVNAKIEYINTEKGYYAYLSADGHKGYGLLTPNLSLSVGMEVQMILYLRRSKDGEKRPHPADLVPLQP